MRIKLWDSTRSRRKSNFLLILTTLLWAFAAHAGDPPIDRDFLRLPDGRWISLEKTGWEKTTVMLGHGKKCEKNTLWSKDYESNDDRSWAYAYFVHLKPGKLAYDINGDGRLEVGVATYDLGLLMVRDILIFTVGKDQMKLLREQGPYDLAADKSVF